jgi:hypothetical protein
VAISYNKRTGEFSQGLIHPFMKIFSVAMKMFDKILATVELLPKLASILANSVLLYQLSYTIL